MIDIRGSLPKSVTDIYEVGAVLDALSAELSRLSARIESANFDSSISGVAHNVEAWEADMGVPPQVSLSLEQRKNSLLAQMMCYQTQNDTTIADTVTRYMGQGTVVLRYEHAAYTLFVEAVMRDGLFERSGGLEATLRRALPAHLKAVLRYVSSLYSKMLDRQVLLCTIEQQIGSEGI